MTFTLMSKNEHWLTKRRPRENRSQRKGPLVVREQLIGSHFSRGELTEKNEKEITRLEYSRLCFGEKQFPLLINEL